MDEVQIGLFEEIKKTSNSWTACKITYNYGN